MKGGHGILLGRRTRRKPSGFINGANASRNVAVYFIPIVTVPTLLARKLAGTIQTA